MAALARRAVEPSGRPQTARMCCANWLVPQPSMVQWPELWTRGAISLTSSRPSLVTKKLDAEHAHVVERLDHALRPFPRGRGEGGRVICAGASVTSRMPLTWRFSTGS